MAQVSAAAFEDGDDEVGVEGGDNGTAKGGRTNVGEN